MLFIDTDGYSSGKENSDRHHSDQEADADIVSSDFSVAGRVVLNLWRIIRHQVLLLIRYSRS